jgi:hypothetical protein
MNNIVWLSEYSRIHDHGEATGHRRNQNQDEKGIEVPGRVKPYLPMKMSASVAVATVIYAQKFCPEMR